MIILADFFPFLADLLHELLVLQVLLDLALTLQGDDPLGQPRPLGIAFAASTIRDDEGIAAQPLGGILQHGLDPGEMGRVGRPPKVLLENLEHKQEYWVRYADSPT